MQIDLSSELREKVEKYCKDNKITQKEMGQQSLKLFLQYKELEREGFKFFAKKQDEEVRIVIL